MYSVRKTKKHKTMRLSFNQLHILNVPIFQRVQISRSAMIIVYIIVYNF